MSADVSEVRALAKDLGKAGFTTTLLVSRAVAKTAQDIEATAKDNVPYDTGFLLGSISSTIKPMSAEIGPTAKYGAHVEYGTAHMEDQPYMGPALDLHEPTFNRALEQIIAQALD